MKPNLKTPFTHPSLLPGLNLFPSHQCRGTGNEAWRKEFRTECRQREHPTAHAMASSCMLSQELGREGVVLYTPLSLSLAWSPGSP